jgi:DNA-binding response OmpR family regulator
MNATGHLLIIDDEASLRHTLARILQRSGYEVTTAGGGPEALRLIADQPFDLVYLDIRMPEMSGLEVLKIIHTKTPDIPVILFTAQPDVSSAVEALRQGATDYLLKPLKPKTLIETTHAVLLQRMKERRKREIEQQIEMLEGELEVLDSTEEQEPAGGRQEAVDDQRYIRRGQFILDLHARRLEIGGVRADLSPTAFDYLVVLARHAPNVVDYQTLVAEAQGYQAEMREAQELSKWHIHHIRQAIEADARHPVYLITMRNAGYRLVVD